MDDELLIGCVYEVKYHPNLMTLIRFIDDREVVMYDRKRGRNYMIGVDRVGKKVIDIKEVCVETPETFKRHADYVFNKIDDLMAKLGITESTICRKSGINLDSLKNRHRPLTTLTIEKITKAFGLDFREWVKGAL